MKPRFIHITEPPTKPLVFERKGRHVVFMHNVSGKFELVLSAEGAEVFIFGLYTGKGAEEYRIETIQRHTVPGAYSDLFVKGVFDDASKFYYQGLIRIEKGAQQSHAYQKNQNLILSKDVFVESNPFLEILANDVFCTHGSTTGRLSKDDIAYVRTRGISDANARALLVEGFANEVVDKVNEMVPGAVEVPAGMSGF